MIHDVIVSGPLSSCDREGRAQLQPTQRTDIVVRGRRSIKFLLSALL